MEEIFSVATANAVGERTATFIRTQPGFYGVHVENAGSLWFFDTFNNARECMRTLKRKKIGVDNNICKFIVGSDGVPTFDSVCKEV